MDVAPQIIVVLGGSRVPSWVVNPSNAPDMAQDWVNNRAWSKTGGIVTPASSLLTVTRALQKTDLFPTSSSGFAYTTFGSGAAAVTSLGLSVEEARTNVLLNSTAPVTQTTASLGTGVYTLWVNGSGSATPSAGSATITGATAATNGSPGGFTVSVAGTVTVTVSGSLNAFQCELGSFGTSLIITAGATVTRPADVIKLASPPSFGSSLTLYAQGTPQAPAAFAATQPILSADDGTLTNRNQLYRVAGSGVLQSFLANSGGSIAAGTHPATSNSSHKIAGAFAANDLASSLDGLTAEVIATGLTAPVASQLGIGKRADGGSFWNGLIQYTAVWASQRVPNAQLQTMTT